MQCGVAEICILKEVMNGCLWVSNSEVWKLAKKKRDVDNFSLNVPRVCMACWTATKLIDAVVWVFFLIQNTCSFCPILCF